VRTGNRGMTMSVDTVSDTARFSAVDLIGPTSATPLPVTFSSSTFVDFMILETPGNFPDPPVYRHVVGTYTTRVTFMSLSSAAPAVSNSNAGSIEPAAGGAGFFAIAQAPISTPSITLMGEYEIKGPTTTVVEPFTIAMNSSATQRPLEAFLPNQTFANGFAFTPVALRVSYSGAGLFNRYVDDVWFEGGIFPTTTVNYFVPEPTAGVMLFGAAGMALYCARPRR
jgi:hypothetical protein